MNSVVGVISQVSVRSCIISITVFLKFIYLKIVGKDPNIQELSEGRLISAPMLLFRKFYITTKFLVDDAAV